MLTTGSKLFLGATTLAVLAAVITGGAQTGPAAWTASIGLVGVAVALVAVSVTALRFRDHTAAPAAPGSTSDAIAAAEGAQPRSIVPVGAAIGAGLVVAGLATRPVVVVAGLVLLVAVAAEWTRAAIRVRAPHGA